MLTTSWLLALTCAVWAPGQATNVAPISLQDLLQREVLVPNGWGRPTRVEKEFERRNYENTELIRLSAYCSYAPRREGEGFRPFFEQLPEPRDKEAVQRWLRTKFPVGTPVEQAQVFLLLSDLESFERFGVNVIEFYAKAYVPGGLMPYVCSIAVKYDQQRRVTEVTVERAARISKWALVLMLIHPMGV
jgi:hypothetical protein